ncbi:MAG: MBL fold metallo-hydrolase [Actinobacteria bacterium]|nr:MBL fold metallo-hydrolase [Actinomycetota bacterium]MBU1942044.1 MBL fold metallo-hydrolase [Actinomycetota bacterium]MBU2687185.1 MBL fold metallo-hydrolase [Actinomycetota bacterium]
MGQETDGLLHEVTENIYLLRGENGGRFPFPYSVVVTGGPNVLFDTGCGLRTLERLRERVNIDLVVNSHTHPDHFSGNHLFGGVELLVPEAFAGILADLEAMSVRLAGGGEPAEQWLFMVREILGHRPTEPTGTFVEGRVIEAGGYAFEAVHTPGHTADTYCFYDPVSRVLLSFDYDLTPFGPWYGHVESSLPETRASIEKLIGLEPGLVVSSHRMPLSAGIEEAFREYDAVIDRRTEVVLGMLEKGPATPEQLADLSPIYGLKPSFALYHYFESRLIEKHLELLVEEGLASTNESGTYSLP